MGHTSSQHPLLNDSSASLSMLGLTALIVDDERIARRVLREELEDLGVKIVGEAEDGEEALTKIEALQPELVFLDLQMPGSGGFDVIRRLDSGYPLPSIVIVTAFDRHAIEAFDAGAIDYLLKPVGRERLEKCLQRVRRSRSNSVTLAEQATRLQEIAHAADTVAKQQPIVDREPLELARPRKAIGKIIGRVGEELHLLDCSDVLAFQAEREMVWIVTRKQRYAATQTLKALQAKLIGLNFARVHRNALVNLDHVAKLAPLSSRRWLLTVSNNQEFIVSKRQAMAVQKLVSW